MESDLLSRTVEFFPITFFLYKVFATMSRHLARETGCMYTKYNILLKILSIESTKLHVHIHVQL
jgi:hypothetical protein